MRRAVAAATWAVLAAGCEQPRTELVARVESEVAWGAGRTVQSVTLTVRRGGPTGPLRSARTTALGIGSERRPLPLLVGIVPTDDTDTPVWIEALGCRDPNGCTAATAAVAQRAVVRFAVGQTQEVPLLLASACVGATCGSDERCGDGGRCEPATRATVRPFGGVDAGVVDVLARDVPPTIDAAADTGTDTPTVNDIGAMGDAPTVDLPTVDTATSCGPLELRCGAVCVAVLRDPLNCGGCGSVCPDVSGATTMCMGGRCGFACDATHADCDERPSNGCESERSTDHENCGACGHACQTTEECRAGACSLCGAGLLWCAGRGCGNNRTDRDHCAGCETVCPLGYICENFTCMAVACDAGVTADTGGRAIRIQCPDGCVDTESDLHNCGRCGYSCTTGANGSGVVCASGGCRITECVSPFLDCDGSAVNGCETNARDDAHRCGSCTHDCTTVCASQGMLCGSTCRCSVGSTCQCGP